MRKIKVIWNILAKIIFAFYGGNILADYHRTKSGANIIDYSQPGLAPVIRPTPECVSTRFKYFQGGKETPEIVEIE